MGEVIGIYTIGPEIGKGSFAVVYKCLNNSTHQNVAIKSIIRSKLKSKKLIENLEIEISILKSMKHPHIVSLHDHHQTSTHFHLVMDYCSMGDLSYFIRKRNQLSKTHPIIASLLERYPSLEGSLGLNETLVIHFLQQLSSALQFLRDKSLVHRDIKPQNLLLCPPLNSNEEFLLGNYVGLWELPILKIADFGFARFLPSTSMAETLCGSPLYMAPEILRFEKYNAKADLWSVGAVLYEMIVGKAPFKASNHIELLKIIEKTQDRIKFPSAAQVSDSLKRLIKSLLKYSSTERVSFSELFNDELIVTPLQSKNVPLSTSEVDTNLYISEYISPLDRLDRYEISETDYKHVGASNARENEIKQIIHASSPEPDSIPESAQLMQGRNLEVSKKEDVVLDKDYVVVEKRAVEVNAIADELARAGIANNSFQRRNSLGRSDVSVQSNLTASNQQRASRRPSPGTNRRPSFTERRISISISPSNALSKAINIASNRLFGLANTANTANISSEEKFNQSSFSTVLSSPDFANNMLLNKLNLPVSATISQKFSNENELRVAKYPKSDDIILSKLESLATRAHAVNLFADVKFSQLIPSPPSSDGIDQDLLQQNDLLPPKMVKTIGEEGVALYVKTLSLLAKGMEVASEWWNDLDDGYDDKNANYETSIKINGLVQWIRERFNENLEKADFIRLRLDEANASISEQQNHSGSTTFIEPEVFGHSKVMAEKLIFDRALEMSRNAAVNELVKEDLKGCELAYSTAIWMLESLLDDEKNTLLEDNLENEDKALIEKFIISIGNRLSVLKKKLEMM